MTTRQRTLTPFRQRASVGRAGRTGRGGAHRGSQARVGRGERGGSSAIELVVIVPVILLVAGLLIASARYAISQSAVSGAAGEAARTAAFARTAGQARSDATATAQADLHSHGLECLTTTVTIDTAAFNQPAGTPGQVQATVSCTVTYRDLLLPGGSASAATLHATAVQPLDIYRARR